MAGAYRVPTAVQKLGFDSKLRQDSSTQDIFSDLKGVYTDKTQSFGNNVVAHVKLEKGEHARTISLLKNLSGAGVQGRTTQMGNEETQVTREVKCYANTMSNAVPTERWGIDAHDASYLKIVEAVNPALSFWHKEMAGYEMRHALVERYSSNLEVAPISLTAGINKNILVADYDGSKVPTYSATKATYITNINTAVESTPGTKERLSIPVLNDVIYQAQTLGIEMLDIGGEGTWIFTIPSRQKKWLFDPVSSASLSYLVKDADERGMKNRSTTYKMHRYGPLLLVEDPRWPVITVTSSTFVPTYKAAGDTDGRTLSANNDRFDCGFLLGKGAIIEAEAEALFFAEEKQDYGKVIGMAAIRTTGWTIGEYDNTGAAGDDTRHNKSSMLCLMGTN